MKCLSCDVILNDFEATRRYKSSGEPVDLCNHCFEDIADLVPVTIRKDLLRRKNKQQYTYGGDIDNDID